MKNGNGKKAPRRIPEVLTEDEQARLLAQVDNQNPSGTRALAILRTFLDCGLRSAELINLQVKNVDFKDGRMKVRGKGDKDRILYFNGRTHAALQAWLDVKPSSSPLVFTSLDGKRPVNGRVMRRWIKVLGVKAGISFPLHPHTCRHSFASDLLRQTRNLVLVQAAMGHASINTTVIYTHISNPELEQAMKGFRGDAS